MDTIKRDNAVARDLGRFDVLVYGGGLSGWAAAVSLARSGSSVLLAAPRTSLGHEIWASMTTWWPPECELPPLWAEVVGELERVNATRGSMVDPVATQVALERTAEEAGVELLMQVWAHPREDGLLFSGRWGLMAAQGGLCVDATERASLAIEAGAVTRERATDEPVVRRALMVKTGVAEPERIEVGEDLPLVDGSVMAWTGVWPGDVILQAELDLPRDDMTALEIESRRVMGDLAAHLRASRDDFAAGSLVHIAHDPILPRDRVLVATGDDRQVATVNCGVDGIPVARGMMLPAGSERMVAASPALDLGDIAAQSCYHAPNAVALGEAAAAVCAELL